MSSQRTTSPGAATHERILDAAAAELAGDGLAVGRVAARAGVSRQAVHYHFGGSAGLRAALADRGHDLPDPPAAETRERVIEAAIRVMSRPDGSDSFDAIAEEAGVTRGALYHHFGDRRTLLIAVARRLTPLDAIAAELNASEGRPDRDRLLGLARVYERELTARGELIRGLLARARTDPMLAQVLATEIIGRVGQLLFPWIQSRIDAGALRSVHPALILQMLITPIALKVIGAPLFDAIRATGLPLAAEHLDAWVDLALLGLAADGSNRGRLSRSSGCPSRRSARSPRGELPQVASMSTPTKAATARLAA